MAIHAIVGLPGMGKTLYGAHMLRRVKGRRRMSNLFPRSGEWEFCLWKDITEAGNAVVLIDEAHMWFSARDFSKTDQIELAAWQQHRKQGLDLWFTVQDLNRVDVAVRELTAYLHLVKRFGNWVLDSTYYPEDLKEKAKGRPFKRTLTRITPGDYGSYWTEQIIGKKDGTGFDLGRMAQKHKETYDYRANPGKLRGTELRYVRPTTIVLRGPAETRRIPWLGEGTNVAEIVAHWQQLYRHLPSAPYMVAFEFDGPTGLVSWSFADAIASGNLAAAAIAEKLYGDSLRLQGERLAARWARNGGHLPGTVETPPARQQRAVRAV